MLNHFPLLRRGLYTAGLAGLLGIAPLAVSAPTALDGLPPPQLTGPSPQLLQKVKTLLEKPQTWQKIPAKVTLCMYVPDGVNGQIFQYARSYISELPKFSEAARSIGLEMKVTFTSPTQMSLDLAMPRLKRKAHTEVKFQLYTDERVVAEDFIAGECDGAAMSNMRARRFNPFIGSLDAIGALPSYSLLSDAIRVLASPQLDADMVNQQYEVTGIMPVGAAYIMVNDRRLNTLAKAAGKKVAVLDFDKSQAQLVQRVGAQPVAVDFTSMGGKFNNGQVDVLAAPALLFEPLELRKGLTDRATGQVKGGIIRFPIVQLTVVTLMHRNRFPDGVGALVREYSATQLAPAYQFIDATEKRIPAAYWMDVPASDKPGYIKLMRESRIAMTQQGFYHPKMMALLKKIRCRAEPSSYECSLNEE